MLYKKHGFPEDSELVLCTITSVQYNCVFASLDEYENKTGIIHISEIAPGRIRNIRDYVVEGKKVVCKVLRVNEERSHIELSLRRVTEMQKKKKNSILKQEQLAEKMIEFVAKELKMPLDKLYRKISERVLKDYDTIYSCFEDIMLGEFNINALGLDENAAKKLEEMIKQRIKPPEVEISGALSLTSYAPNGVEIIKEVLKKAKDAGPGDFSIKYLGAGKYKVNVKSDNYKDAEEILKKMVDAAAKHMKEKGGEMKFERAEAGKKSRDK